MSLETVQVGRYRFLIQDNTLYDREGNIYSRNFQIGGDIFKDCVNVSISYDANNNPISAKIPTLVYDSECSLDSPLNKGKGTVVMIKTLLTYINYKIPTITDFIFEDMSNIECGTDDEKIHKQYRKRGTHVVPVSLSFFSIAFNHITWYEKHFNAYQKDIKKHRAYRKHVNDLLDKKEMKPDFYEFLRIAQPQVKYLDELQTFYEKTLTYGDFFKSIPNDDRCRLVRDWISTFMTYYLQGVFTNIDWVINVRTMNNVKNGGGTRKRGRVNTTKYYCPVGKINLSFEQKDIGCM